MAGDEEPGDAAPARRAAGPRIVKGMLGVLGGLVLLVLLAVFGLDTGPGHRFVADQIRGLTFENGMKIRVGRIEGSIYGAMRVHDLSIRDTKGEFLFSPQVDIDWRPFAYLQNHVDIRTATAQRMILRRAPAFRPTPPSDAPLLPDFDIDVDRLSVAQFIAEKPVTGERRVASISGKAHIADGRAQITFDGRTARVGQQAGGDMIRLVLDAVPDRDRLAIEVAIDAPRGGVIAALAGLEAPLTVRASGKGEWKAWNGRFDANLDGQELARLAFTGRDGTFRLAGPARMARMTSGATAQLLGRVTRLDLVAAFDRRRARLSGSVDSDAFALKPSGIVDFSANTFEDLRLAFTLLRPSALAPNLSGSGLRGLFTLNGAFATPQVAYAVNADQLVMNDVGLEQVTATGEATVNADRILIPVTARAGRITGLDAVAGGTLTQVRLDGDLAIDGPRILSDNMRIRSDRIDATAILLADMQSGLYTGAINGRIDDYRLASVGVFTIDTDVDLKSETGGFALAGKVRARSTRLTNPGVQSFLGGNTVASSDVRYGPDGVVRFANLRLEAPLLRVTGGRGSYSPDGRITLDADGVSRAYGRVGVQVAGTIASPQAVVTAERPGLGIGLANLRARVTGARGGYRLAATGDTDYGPLTADVTLGTGGPTSLLINSANLGGIDFAGSLRQTRTGPFAGQLTATGQGLGGVVRLGAQGRYQEAVINLRANNTVLPGPAQLAIGSAIVDARVVLYDRPWIVADAQLSQTRYGAFDLAAARVIVDYRDGRGQAKALVEGTSGIPFRVAVNAQLEPNLWRAMLSGRARGIAFRTTSPARIVPGKGGYELLPTRVDFGSGKVRLAGRYGPGIRVESRMDALDLGIVNAFAPGLGIGGTATGSLDFAQASSTAFPSADARLSIRRFTRTTAVSVSQPVDVNFVGKLLPDGGEARAVFRERGSVIGRMVASMRPLGPGAGTWSARLSQAPLSGGIRYNGPADTLFSFAGSRDQQLSGPIGVAADFSCRVAAPCLNGVVRANALTYENQTYGTRLTQMALSGRFSGDRLTIERLTAKAGNGTVAAQGFASLSAEAGYPMDIAATLDNARLARSDAISARATGSLRLTKAAGETALLSGQLRLPETRYKVVREGAAQVPELTGVRFKPPRGPKRITGDEPARPMPGLLQLVRLDLGLVAPEKLYVSGMGLDSEWRANFKVSGTSAVPVLAGEVALLRGNLDFAGRSFELVQGRVQFTGGPTIDPTVAMQATDDVEDVTVNVNVAGRASNPQITFTSVPGLPQDEIMARVLFGSSIANLSAIQAVQLASSLNSLRGSGGGLNPLGKLRSAAGIDRLRILGADETTGRGTALAAGQYITDDIYVEVITDARGFTATQLEIALTRWLSLLSQASGSGVSNVNVRIKKNY
jgi:translocation and assembly module TamB